MLGTCGLAGCASAPEPPTAKPREIGTGPGIVLSGRIVTMNDANEVMPRGHIWLRDGRIAAVWRDGTEAPPGSSAARVVDTGGAIYPGLIDIHNHPEYAIYPALPITTRYRDRYEWRYYDDAYQKRISGPNVVMGSRDFYNLGDDVGRYGEWMALIGGTTSVQGGGSGLPSAGAIEVGGRHYRPHAQAGCLARNVETEIDLAPVRSWVDMGRDVPQWQRLQADSSRGALVVHMAEGASARMADEFRAAKNSALVNANLVVVHGVALDQSHFADMRVAGAKLVWSPLSNFLLYGKTADVAAALDAGVAISLAPDWAPSGSKSLLGEIKVADIFNRERLRGRVKDVDLVRMATRNPAAALGWAQSLGQIAPGFLADIVVIDDRHEDPYRNLIESNERQVRATIVRGVALYGDVDLIATLRGGNDNVERVPLFVGRAKGLVTSCGPNADSGFAPTLERIDAALKFDPAATLRFMDAKRIGAQLKRCPGEPPLAGEPTAADARRLLACRFGLPFEATRRASLVADGDAEYWSRLFANPNLPHIFKRLADYYR